MSLPEARNAANQRARIGVFGLGKYGVDAVALGHPTGIEHDDAIARFDAALQRLTEKIGATAKYNAMITWLFLKLIAARARTGEDWCEFRRRNADLLDDRSLPTGP